jgi:hypothetical protein
MVTGVTTFNTPIHAASNDETTLRIIAVGERGDGFPVCVVFLAVNDRGKARWFEAGDIVLTEASIAALRKYAARRR